MDLEDVFKLLQTSDTGIGELAQVSTFIGTRRGGDDVERGIMVEIFDAGAVAGEMRFAIEVTEDPSEEEAEDDPDDELTIRATGADLQAAIAALAWEELDRT